MNTQVNITEGTEKNSFFCLHNSFCFRMNIQAYPAEENPLVIVFHNLHSLKKNPGNNLWTSTECKSYKRAISYFFEVHNIALGEG